MVCGVVAPFLGLPKIQLNWGVVGQGVRRLDLYVIDRQAVHLRPRMGFRIRNKIIH